jgi:hypothetical protein
MDRITHCIDKHLRLPLYFQCGRQPIKWNMEAQRSGSRRRVFCASMADVFESRVDLHQWRERLWPLIDATPNLDWLLLTKRPQNVERMELTLTSGSVSFAEQQRKRYFFQEKHETLHYGDAA